jgi:DNA (cytosine-5)-methyltransferase 1
MARARNKNSDPRFTWYEFFAGGGMARLGLGHAWSCIFANELSPKKAAAYMANFGPSPELKVDDVARLTTADLPRKAHLAWASFPCQDLSLAGNGAGLNGHRSGTFWPFWRLIENLIPEARKPTVVVLENVVGAITSHGGDDFRAILDSVACAGYRVGAMVLDAVHFVPQSRPRLFIVAADDTIELPSALVRPAPNAIWHSDALVSAHSAFDDDLAAKWIWWNLPVPTRPIPPVSALIEAEPSGVEWHSATETRRLLSLMSETNRAKVRAAQKTGELKVGTIYRRTRPVKLDGHVVGKTQRAEVRFDEISGCLRTPTGGSSRQTVLIVEGKKVRSRLLSPREAARLMGVPDSYPLPERYNDAYHLFGDGLAVPVVSWLEHHLLRPLVEAAHEEHVTDAPTVNEGDGCLSVRP